jgi:hypothetical protein
MLLKKLLNWPVPHHLSPKKPKVFFQINRRRFFIHNHTSKKRKIDVWSIAQKLVRRKSALISINAKGIMKILEHDFTSAVKSAIPDVAQVSASWQPDSLYLNVTVCSSYGAETIRLRIQQDAVKCYIALSRIGQGFARYRLARYFAMRFNEYRSDRGYYFLHTKLADPEWTVTPVTFMSSFTRAKDDKNPEGFSTRLPATVNSDGGTGPGNHFHP